MRKRNFLLICLSLIILLISASAGKAAAPCNADSYGVPEATRKKNIGRRPKELAIEPLAVYLPGKQCANLAARRSHAASDAYAIFKDIHSVAQLEAANFWRRICAEVARLGGASRFPQFDSVRGISMTNSQTIQGRSYDENR